MINISQEQIHSLQQLYSQYSAEYEAAQKRLEELTPIMMNLSGLLHAFDSKVVRPAHADDQQSPQPPPLKGVPMRKPQYTEMTLIQAAQQILSQKAAPMHADELVRAIYEIRNTQNFAAAKRNVVSELIRGQKRGIFKRARGKNRFALEEVSLRRLVREPSPNGDGL